MRMIQCDSCNKWVHYNTCAGVCETTIDVIYSVCIGNGQQVAGKPKEVGHGLCLAAGALKD